MILLILFFCIGTAEIFLLLKMGAEFGTLRTIAYLVLKAAIGIFFTQLEAFAAVRAIKTRLEKDEDMVDAVLELLYVLFGGVLIIVPGVVCTCIGILFIIRPTRIYFVTRTNPKLRKRIEVIVAEKRREYLAKKAEKEPA